MPVGFIRIEGPYTTAERDALTGMPPNMCILNSDTGFEWWNDGAAAWQPMPSNHPTFDGLTVRELSVTEAIQTSEGGNRASASDMTLMDAQLFTITGTTQINRIYGSLATPIILVFAGSLTVKHNQAAGGGFFPIALGGSVDFATATGDVLVLAAENSLMGSLVWREIARTLA